MKQRYKKSTRMRMEAGIIAAALAIVAIFGFVYAKYMFPGVSEWAQTLAPKYYFTADLLGDTEMVNAGGTTGDIYRFGPESTEGTWNLYGGSSHTLTVNLQNYFDDLRITRSSLNYTTGVEITVPAGGIGYEASNVTVTPASGMLSGGVKSVTALSVRIPDCGTVPYSDGTVVTVSISSLKPYQKTLTLNFVLNSGVPKLSYCIIDNAKSPYAELQILVGEIGDEELKPALIWPDSLYIDNANEFTFTIEGGVITQQPGIEGRNMELSRALKNRESESIYFFKEDINADYSLPVTVVTPDGHGRYVINLTARPAGTVSAGAGE